MHSRCGMLYNPLKIVLQHDLDLLFYYNRWYGKHNMYLELLNKCLYGKLHNRLQWLNALLKEQSNCYELRKKLVAIPDWWYGR